VFQDIVKAKPAERVLDNWAVGLLSDWTAGKNGSAKTKAALKEELCALIDELAGPTPSAVERVLAEIAATSWFAYRMNEAQYASHAASEMGLTHTQSEHAQRRMDRAHRRFLSTLKTLAAVRRLALPALQRNVARQQVNRLNTGGQS
jgi:hypothetical protein